CALPISATVCGIISCVTPVPILTRNNRPAKVTAQTTLPLPESTASAIPAASCPTDRMAFEAVSTTQHCGRPAVLLPSKFAVETNSTVVPSADSVCTVHDWSDCTSVVTWTLSPGPVNSRSHPAVVAW